MSKTLVIVESPGKIKKIQDILGNNYIVKASCGHVYDLPEKGMNIDVKNNFKPTYAIKSDKKNVVFDLKKVVSKCNNVILATDDDAEGEFIAWSLMKVLSLNDPDRIIFNSITKKEILNAVKNKGKINYDKVHSQQARRLFDRLEGYDLSDLARKCVQWGCTAGRVQSVVTRIVIDRENNIEAFYKKGSDSFYKITGTWKLDEKDNDDVMDSILYKRNKKQDSDSDSDESFSEEEEDEDDKKNDKQKSDTIAKMKDPSTPPEKIKQFLKKCQKEKFIIDNIYDKKKVSQPSAPYTTLTMQQDAFTKHGFSMSSTMKLAQTLYEKGLITYMRTDSVSLSKEAMDNIKDYVIDTHGKDYYRHKLWITKDKSAQEAHEAIRPTHIDKTPENVKLNEESLKKLYTLIWKRTVASQMSPAEFAVKYIEIVNELIDPYYFLAKYEKLIFDGYLILDNKKNNSSNYKKYSKLKKKDKVYMDEIIATQEWSTAPSRYTQASLLSQLKKLGIGRPATYAKMIDIVQKRGYVIIDNVKGKEIQRYVLSISANKDGVKEKKITQSLDKKKKVYSN